MDVVTLLADRLRLHDAMPAPQQRLTDDTNNDNEVDDRDSGTASDDESAARAEGDIVDLLMIQSLTAAAAAAQRQESSMTSLLEVAATASCRRSSFSGQLHLPLSSSSAVCRQTTFRPVVAARPAVRCGLRRSSAAVRLIDASWSPCDDERPSDDESCNLATRKRRHDDDSSDDALTSSAASDDDEEVKTIFSDELTMTSRAPGNGVEKRNWSLPPRRATAAAVNDCSVVHRPSLNLYKMQRMRIGRRVSLMRRHSPLGRPRPLAALQSSTNATHHDSTSTGKCELGNSAAGVPAYHFRSLTTATKRSCVAWRRPVCDAYSATDASSR